VAGADGPLPVCAYAVSATLQPKAAAALFPPEAERVRVTKTRAVLRYAGGIDGGGADDGAHNGGGADDGAHNGGWAVVHDFGAFVFIGVAEGERARMMKALVGSLSAEPHPPLEETFAVEIAPGSPPAVRFDRVVVAQLDLRVVEILALVVAQSVAMEYYEGDVDALVVGLEQSSRALAAKGRLRGSAREMLRFIGRGMSVRTQVVHTLSLLDSPGATWDDEALDRLYRGLRTSFEIEERYRSLDHELGVVQDNLELLVDMVRHRRTLLLEVAVAVFVGAELLILLVELLLGTK
jgi:uncharacterized Rmd1/YagE family protein